MIDGPRTQVVVTFDKALVPIGAINLANWTVRFNDINYVLGGAQTVGSTALLAVAGGLADPGLNRVSFDPPPDDVVTLENARPVVAFTDFPLTA